jgi:hypothetical protein
MNPWLSIWKSPRETIRYMLEQNKTPLYYSIIALYGLTLTFEQATNQSIGDKVPFGLVLLVIFLIGPLTGYLYWIIQSGLFYLVGRWLGGYSNWEEAKSAVVWSSILYLYKLPIFLIQLVLLGNEVFSTKQPTVENSMLISAVFGLLTLADIVITIWYVVVLSKAIGEIHNFSAWKGFGVILLSTLIIIIVLVLVGLLLSPLF